MNNRVAVYRKEHFNAAHRLYNPAWDEKTNYSVFGKCANPNYHGHNYDLVVKVTGVVNKDTGYVMDMKELSDIIKDNVLDEFDHKNLNMDVSFFKELIPTAENICMVIHQILSKKIDSKFEIQVRLFETERNFVEYPV
jgi:6-pyruvoyltetrahydropterin/6-carboxytetrahydropterin synthase